MLTLHSNFHNIIGRLLLTAITFIAGYIIINFTLKEPGNGKAIYLLYFIISILGYLAFTLTFSLLCTNKIVIDKTIDTITFIGLISKQKISSFDIAEYFEIYAYSRSKEWYGILIKTKNKKTIQVVEQNIKSLYNFKCYLDEIKVLNSGKKKMKYPFN